MLSANAFLATRGKTPGNKIVEGKDAWPARDDDEKTGRPDAVGRPGIGIDENFDDRGHAEKGQRGQAAGEAHDEQDRTHVPQLVRPEAPRRELREPPPSSAFVRPWKAPVLMSWPPDIGANRLVQW